MEIKEQFPVLTEFYKQYKYNGHVLILMVLSIIFMILMGMAIADAYPVEPLNYVIYQMITFGFVTLVLGFIMSVVWSNLFEEVK